MKKTSINPSFTNLHYSNKKTYFTDEVLAVRGRRKGRGGDLVTPSLEQGPRFGAVDSRDRLAADPVLGGRGRPERSRSHRRRQPVGRAEHRHRKRAPEGPHKH